MPDNEPSWLTLEQVIDINEQVVAATGEGFLVRDEGLLESAVMRPKNYWDYPGEGDIVTLACILLQGIAQNHPFEQGNKRTALIAAGEMLRENGYDLDPPDEIIDAEGNTETGVAIEGLVEGTFDLDDFTEFLRPYVTPRG